MALDPEDILVSEALAIARLRGSADGEAELLKALAYSPVVASGRCDGVRKEMPKAWWHHVVRWPKYSDPPKRSAVSADGDPDSADDGAPAANPVLIGEQAFDGDTVWFERVKTSPPTPGRAEGITISRRVVDQLWPPPVAIKNVVPPHPREAGWTQQILSEEEVQQRLIDQRATNEILASAEWQAANAASREQHRKYAQGLFDEPVWPGKRALSWIAFRAEARIEEDWSHALFYPTPALPLRDPAPGRTLLRALQLGEIGAMSDGRRLPPEAWAGATKRSLEEVWLYRADVINRWPFIAAAGAPDAVSDTSTPAATSKTSPWRGTDDATSAPPEPGANADVEPRPRPGRVSDAKLRQWFDTHIKERLLAGERLSEAKVCRAASDHFNGTAARSRVRDLYEEIPAELRGRRGRPRGQKDADH
jgi:hypothetical protein